ncbi:hypothetical protein MMC21_005296 [Puttea exsequens]|nr:hypothetical protein [Puttea exsequens]
MIVEGSDGFLRPRQPGQLECPLQVLGCHAEFSNADYDDWRQHSFTHFFTASQKVVPPPTSNACPFCEVTFQNDDGYLSWDQMLQHIRLHHLDASGLEHGRPDLTLIRYLWQNRVIEDEDYQLLTDYQPLQQITKGEISGPLSIPIEYKNRSHPRKRTLFEDLHVTKPGEDLIKSIQSNRPDFTPYSDKPVLHNKMIVATQGASYQNVQLLELSVKNSAPHENATQA